MYYQMIVKIALNWTHCHPFYMLKPDVDLCMRLDLLLDKKTVENQDWATGPPGCRTIACGPPSRGEPRAVGRWAAGPQACF